MCIRVLIYSTEHFDDGTIKKKSNGLGFKPQNILIRFSSTIKLKHWKYCYIFYEVQTNCCRRKIKFDKEKF